MLTIKLINAKRVIDIVLSLLIQRLYSSRLCHDGCALVVARTIAYQVATLLCRAADAEDGAQVYTVDD